MTTKRKKGNVLVTGAHGFIGRVLCAELRRTGHWVRGADRSIALGDGRLGESGVDELVTVDLLHDRLDHVVTADIDAIVHLAGKAHALTEVAGEEDSYFQANTEITRRLLEAAKKAKVPRFTLASTIKAMGEGGERRLDEAAATNPKTPYGRSKLAAEKLVLEGGFVAHGAVLRLCMVYGTASKGNLDKMIRAIDAGRFPPLPAFNNRRSMVHVNDVVRAFQLVTFSPQAKGQIYIVNDGRDYSTEEITRTIQFALGKRPARWHLPLSLLRLLARSGDLIGTVRGRRFGFDSDALEKLSGSACYSAEKIKRELNFVPQHSLPSSIASMVANLRQH